jgi:hypothetical protein
MRLADEGAHGGGGAKTAKARCGEFHEDNSMAGPEVRR